MENNQNTPETSETLKPAAPRASMSAGGMQSFSLPKASAPKMAFGGAAADTAADEPSKIVVSIDFLAAVICVAFAILTFISR